MSTISSSTTSTTAFGVTADTTGALVIQTGATPTTAMTITTGQLVGIGTTSPTVQLLNIAATSISGPTNNPAGVQLTDSGASLSSQIVNRSGNTLHNVPSTKAHSFQVNSTETVTLNTYGVGLGGTTPTSGMGIAFPATQSASSDANTLDDYEEGTWTPTFGGGSSNPTVTYSNQYGYYTKIGNLVYLTFRIGASAYSGGGGALYIKGMPFSVSSQSNDFGVLSLGYANNWSTSPPTYGRYTNGNNFMELYYLSGVTETTVLVGQASAGTQLIMNIVYQAA